MKARDIKAVIPVAGLGTRMLPATKAIPKEMLPIVDKPLIQYIVNECVGAGIKEIILVTHSSKNAIENHFDTSFELETILEKRIKRQLLDEIQNICPEDVTIFHVRQKQALGLGHAVLCAYPIIRENPFVVVLPDVLLKNPQANLKAMLDRFLETGNNQLLVEPVAKENVNKYGIVDIKSHQLQAGATAPLASIVEKPEIDEAPSNLAIVGRYVFTSHLWKELQKTQPGKGGEIQLTDAVARLLSTETCEAFHIVDKSYDCGDKLGYMKAFVEYGIEHEVLGRDFKQYLKTICNEDLSEKNKC